MSNVPYSRLNKDDAVVLLVDHQTGLISLVQDFSPNEFKNNVLALGDIAKFFNLPTILTTSFDSGPNGPIAGNSAQFGFTSDKGGTFECSLDSAPWAACTSQYDGSAVAMSWSAPEAAMGQGCMPLRFTSPSVGGMPMSGPSPPSTTWACSRN